MPKIKFECDGDIDQNTIDELLEVAAKKQVSCKFETRAAVVAKVESGAAKSEREAERQVADETGENEETVRSRNKRAKKAELGSKNQDEPTHGGARPGAGRPLEREHRPPCTQCGKNLVYEHNGFRYPEGDEFWSLRELQR